MTIRPLLLIAALAAVPAAAAAQTSAAPIQTGTYALEILFGGGVIEGRLEVTGRDSLRMALFVGEHQSPVRLGQRRGNTVILESTVPGMDVRYELTFRGAEVTGTFRYDGQDGTVTGRRRSAGVGGS